jgi:peptidoglycan/LPS O-acetylase OafA/YrhL
MRFERIDQLRGFAALAVVACHLSVSAFVDAPNASDPSPRWLPLVLGFGYLGVPLFFVISGFCIHLPQARALAAGHAVAPSWTAFFRRRFWRLYPSYLGALALAVLLLFLAYGALTVSWRGLLAQALLVQTLHPATFDGVNPPAWTLAVEAQLYLAYPIALALIVRLGTWRALGAVAAVTMLYRGLLNLDPLPAGFGGVAWELFLARWLEWVLGAAIAAWAVGEIRLPAIVRSPWLAALVLAAAVAFEWHAWRPGFYTFKEPLDGIAFALVVIVALDRTRVAGLAAAGVAAGAGAGVLGAGAGGRARDDGRSALVRRLGRWLAGVGVYSYSLYLLHRPIQLALEPLARRLATEPFVIEHGIPSSILLFAASTPLVLWVSRVFYRWCEAPSIAYAQRVGREPTAVAPIEVKREPAAMAGG